MDELSKRWQKEKQHIHVQPSSVDEIIAIAQKKKKSTRYFHYGNIIILSITLVMISLFFYYVAPFKETLSRFGVLLMVGGLFVRIIIEIFSVFKFKKIRLTDDALQTTEDYVDFYEFRKKIHGPVTITIVALYCIGFYFLSPEFSLYIPMLWMVLMHVSFVLGAAFLIWQIRKGIVKEMEDLSELTKLRQDIGDA